MIARILVVSLIVAASIFAAGCSQPSAPPATPDKTPVPTSVPPATAVTPPAATTIPPTTPAYLPGPMPRNFEVTVDVDRNVVAIDPRITVMFRGGKGMTVLHSVDVVVTRSDDSTEKASMIRPQVGASVEIVGTTGTDRVQVFVTLVTKDPPPGPYLIYDEKLPFRSRG